MNEDFSEVLNKFSSILKDKNIDLNDIVGGNKPPTNSAEENSFFDNTNNSFTESNFSDNNTTCSSDSDTNNDFNIDIQTIMKIKEILSSINKSNHCPRNKLLSALKPYLEENKKEKLEQYIKIANLLTVLENFDNHSKPKFSESNYDFILILTLFLLLF